MNEITRVHIGRQQFTISVDAHRELKNYLADIKKQVNDNEVVNEVESRMSELLIDRGVIGEKVVLPEDIDYLKEQLGTPDDFGDEAESVEADEETGTKRLFRDADNAILGGVGAGIANYFGLDIVLVRLAIVLLTLFSFGTSIILYIVLWLIVPPANTTSEKLQMHGKSVTLGALKNSVSAAEVKSTARRVNSSVLSVIDAVFRVCVKLVGISLALFGIMVLFGAAATRMYMSLHDGKLFQENLFPVGFREQLLVWIGMGLVVMFSIFMILAGVAIFRRKWPINGWLTGVLATVFLAGSVVVFALAADAAPRLNQRYHALTHVTGIEHIEPFNKVVTTGSVDLTYIASPTYAANVRYVGDPDLSKLKIHVAHKTLYVDSQQLDRAKHCTMLCLFPRYNMTVQIYAPNIVKFDTPPHTDIFYRDTPPPVLEPSIN
jgi:phage shock protein PspC (stress-responsive transcriptional regulator)